MPTQRPKLIDGEIYHIILRAVGDTVVFVDENDFYRGIFSLYEFNNSNSVTIWNRRRNRIVFKGRQVKLEKFERGQTPLELQQEVSFVDDRDKLVEVLAFCFMPNHIHIIAKQLQENGISNFVKKVSGGYASHSNIKYDRKGHFFNRFKAVHIKTDEQFENALVYVWCNPISLVEPGWKEKGIKDEKKVIKFLEGKYRWSSFFDCIGKKNFPSVIDKEFVLKAMDGEEGCKQAVKNWIKYKKN